MVGLRAPSSRLAAKNRRLLTSRLSGAESVLTAMRRWRRVRPVPHIWEIKACIPTTYRYICIYVYVYAHEPIYIYQQMHICI